ncbi:thiamine transport system ATP-binding protein [Neorhizobium galegae]|uniref:thiamine ABC transporter ATP-binding protein n=1 Tax=Neorhizobium galegae TaxID=399 RepID=UPI001AE54D93|nr:ATP-binding cassette domain-containing protein [Neorhizobium galegae]MBP2562691.1 thiamine transport system ATP-binding protein [Neorhizobium galegae]MDQ0137263.1 thiamine transport system ATP-binding protein [Neorhizobium galegae]
MADGIVLEKVELRLGTKEFRFDCVVSAGAVTAITGPSGSGKSTFLNLVAGFEAPDRGRILIAGEDVTEKHPSERPVSLVFQDNNLFAHLDLATNIGLGISPSLKLSGSDRAAISQALERVGLGGFEKRMPGTLSGGERQRAAFARALVRRKPVLLMDEPFAALDPGLRLSMASLLIDLHRETGNTVLIVTHDPDEVGRLADHAIFIDHGQISLQAPAEEFLARRDIPALAGFLSG